MRFLSLPLALLLATPAAAAPALCPATVKAIDKAARNALERGTPGMIVEVAQHGRPLFVGTYGKANLELAAPVRPNSVFRFGSVTKQFTAALVLSLVQEGKIGLDDPVSRFIPELEVAKGVTVRDLLQQTSGLPDYAGDDPAELKPAMARSSAQMLDYLKRRIAALDFAPGTAWAYSNSNYVLLGIIAERASGKSFAELFAERIGAKVGSPTLAIDDPADVVPGRASGYRKAKGTPSGYRNANWLSPTVPGPAGSLRGTAADLVRWHAALFGGRILSPAMLALMTAPGRLRDGRTTKLGMPIEWQKGLNSDYAMGLFVKPTAGGTRFGHGGDLDGFSAWAAYYPASGVSIVQIVNSESVDQPTDAIEAAVFAAGPKPCVSRVGRR